MKVSDTRIVLTGKQIKQALEFVNPDGDKDLEWAPYTPEKWKELNK